MSGRSFLWRWAGYAFVTAVGALCSGTPALATWYSPQQLLVRWSPSRAKAGVDDNTTVLPAQYEWLEEIPIVAPRPEDGHGAAKPATSALQEWSLLRYAATADALVVSAEVAEHPAVACAQPNYLRSFTSGFPNDPLFSEQENLRAINWDSSLSSGRPVVVAIIDSGVDIHHPDLAAQLWRNEAEADGQTGVDDDANGYVDDIIGWDFSDAPGLPGEGDYLRPDADPKDESGHGTHVAGIVGAAANNGVGISGVAPAAKLMILRAGFNVSGSGFLEDDDIAAAVVYAVDNGADILNMSFGDPVYSPLIADAVRYAESAGCLVVAAVGNEGNNEIFYPARLKDAIAVSAVDNHGSALSFSNWGYSVDVAAPGLAIQAPALGGGYALRSGTSMAAAHVAGIAAAVWSRQPHLVAQQVRGAISNSARDVGAIGWDPHTGAGLVQLAAARLKVPIAVAVAELAPESVGADPVGIVGSVWGVGGTKYELSLENEAGSTVIELLHGTIEGSQTRFVTSIETADLESGFYVLRLEAGDGMGAHSQRLSVHVRRTPVKVSGLRLVRALDGAYWTDRLEWQYDLPTAGSAALLDAGGDTALIIPFGDQRLDPSVVLPHDLPRGEYTATILPHGVQDEATQIAIFLENVGISRWPLSMIGSFPDGYLLPQTTDFNDDGVPEVVAMSYTGSGYNPTNFFHVGRGEPVLVYTSSLPFIPWNTHDLDGDGKSEIMAVDAERVRLLEARSPGLFPNDIALEVVEVWGGEVADSDRDGLLEMFLRSSRSAQFRVFETRGDNQFEEVEVLANPSEGFDGLGDRQVATDLDGDGWGEILAGDEDGDLFIYEAIADNTWRNTWKLRRSEGDSRVVAGGFDTDADGRVEFVVASLDEDDFDLRRTRWTVSLYEASGDNAFDEMWSIEAVGGVGSGNGISAGDFNGDGTPEIVVALAPDLYLFRTGESGAVQPVWHAGVVNPKQPLVADVDQDGTVDLIASGGGRLNWYSLGANEQGSRLDAPTDLIANATGSGGIAISWAPVAGAALYRLFRGLGESELSVLAPLLLEPLFHDGNVTEGTEYRYAVEALDSLSSQAGYRSRPVVAIPEPQPVITSVGRVGSHHILVHFDAPMGLEIGDNYRYHVISVGVPTSSAVHGGRRRVLLAFPTLPVTGEFVLETRGLHNYRGTPLVAESMSFKLTPPSATVRLISAQSVSATRLDLQFSETIAIEVGSDVYAQEFANRHFSIDGGSVEIEEILFEGDMITLLLSSETPLRPIGRSYHVTLTALEDATGRPIEGTALVGVSAESLADMTVFPNPFKPNAGDVTVAGLPLNASVTILSVAGEVVWRREELDGNGGLNWDGRNGLGRPVAAGIYFVHVQDGSSTQLRKLALIRGH